MGTKFWCHLYMGHNFFSHVILHVIEYLMKYTRQKFQSYAIYTCDQNFICIRPDRNLNLM